MELLQQNKIKTEIISPVQSDAVLNENENLCKLTSPNVIKDNKDKVAITPNSTILKLEHTPSLADGKKNVQGEQEQSNKMLANSTILKLEHTPSLADGKKNVQGEQEQRNKILANIKCEWSTKKSLYSEQMIGKGAVLKNIPRTPHAYYVKDVIQRNREEAIRLRLEQEKKRREFHARPVPYFIYQPVRKFEPVHSITFPITPQVLKNSHKSAEKRIKKMDEMKQQLKPLKFESRPPTVLKEKPFVPQKKSPTVIQQCPFRLSTEKRLEERKRTIEMIRKVKEEKQKQKAEEQKRLEREKIKELKKAATFKAKPNPFKH